jgi:hypothetical protein
MIVVHMILVYVDIQLKSHELASLETLSNL